MLVVVLIVDIGDETSWLASSSGDLCVSLS